MLCAVCLRSLSQLGQYSEVLLQQDSASSVENIPVHGINGTTQNAG